MNETSWKQQGHLLWLWVFTCPQATRFVKVVARANPRPGCGALRPTLHTMPDRVQTDSSPARTLRGSTEIAMWSAIP